MILMQPKRGAIEVLFVPLASAFDTSKIANEFKSSKWIMIPCLVQMISNASWSLLGDNNLKEEVNAWIACATIGR